MIEQWQQSLGELDATKPSPDLWDQAVARSAEGPPIDFPSDVRGRIIAGVIATIVAVVGVVVAFLTLRGIGTKPGTDELSAYRDPAGAWEIRYPDGFRQGTIPQLSMSRVTFEGIWIGNFNPPDPPDDAGGPLYYEVPDDGLVVLVSQRFGGPLFIPRERDSSFPISLEDIGVVPGPYRGVYRERTVVANGEAHTITIRIGPEASQEDQQAAADIVSSFRFLPLEEGTAIGEHLAFYVLGPPNRYAVGSVTRIDASSLPRTEAAVRFPFYLVHTSEGFYALAWPDDVGGGYKDCEVTYEAASQEFSCPNGARWALDGSVIEKPAPDMPDDPLAVLLVRISLDGHILVSPNVFSSDTELDLRMTSG